MGLKLGDKAVGMDNKPGRSRALRTASSQWIWTLSNSDPGVAIRLFEAGNQKFSNKLIKLFLVVIALL